MNYCSKSKISTPYYGIKLNSVGEIVIPRYVQFDNILRSYVIQRVENFLDYETFKRASNSLARLLLQIENIQKGVCP